MRYYHTTDAAEAILRDGFRDSEGHYGFATLTLRGVWLADSPVDVNEGAVGDKVLAVNLSIPLAEYEIVEEGKPYREWCVPADLINAQGTVTLMTQDEVDEVADQRWRKAAVDLAEEQ